MYQQTAICSTLNAVPMTASALQASRLPFAIHIYPFSQDAEDPEDPIQLIKNDCPIVRCAVCRAYINPHVRINDQRSWQCNLCNRLNELPPEFYYDHQYGQYIDLSTKPELTYESVEYQASVEYMVRPPQPSCFIFVFDCSKAATDLGYIPTFAKAIKDLITTDNCQIPGDARLSIGFLAFDANIHYFSFAGTRVVHYVNPDVSSPTMPCTTDGILATIATQREMIVDFLTQTLPTFATNSTDTKSAMGPAIQIASKIIAPIGGKIVVIQAQLPNHGDSKDGSVLQRRDDPTAKKVNLSQKNSEYLTPLINPASDFYKNISLEACEHQVSIDLFNLSTSYSDIASLGQMVKYCAGNVYYYSNSISERRTTLIRFYQDLTRYLRRKLGLESVLRLRYSRGLKIHTFHGNFFVRSSNLLSLPIINPDSGYALQIAIDDDLKPSTRHVFFQASVLYTASNGERRIRVHTAKFPTASTLPEIIYNANQIAIIGMLAKMAVDRSLKASIGEAKEALIGAGVDLLEIYSIADEMRAKSYPMSLPENLRLVPLFILALLKHTAFKIGPTIKLDDRSAAMERFKTLPVDELMTYIYPDLYPLHTMANDPNEEWRNPMSLSAAYIEKNGAYLLDAYDVMIIYICQYIDPRWCYECFGVQDYASVPEHHPDDQQTNVTRPRDPANFTVDPSTAQNSGLPGLIPSADEVSTADLIPLPNLQNQTSNRLIEFIGSILDSRPQQPKFYIIKETSRFRSIFTQYLIDDRSESYHSYAEFWKFLQDQAHK